MQSPFACTGLTDVIAQARSKSYFGSRAELLTLGGVLEICTEGQILNWLGPGHFSRLGGSQALFGIAFLSKCQALIAELGPCTCSKSTCYRFLPERWHAKAKAKSNRV